MVIVRTYNPYWFEVNSSSLLTTIEDCAGEQDAKASMLTIVRKRKSRITFNKSENIVSVYL